MGQAVNQLKGGRRRPTWNSSCTTPAEYAGGRIVSARAGIVRVVRVNCGGRPADCHYDTIKDGNAITCDNLGRGAAERRVGDEIHRTVAAGRIKFQHGIGVDHTTTYIKSAVVAESSDFYHVGPNVCVVDVNRPAIAIVFDVHCPATTVGRYQPVTVVDIDAAAVATVIRRARQNHNLATGPRGGGAEQGEQLRAAANIDGDSRRLAAGEVDVTAPRALPERRNCAGRFRG